MATYSEPSLHTSADGHTIEFLDAGEVVWRLQWLSDRSIKVTTPNGLVAIEPQTANQVVLEVRDVR